MQAAWALRHRECFFQKQLKPRGGLSPEAKHCPTMWHLEEARGDASLRPRPVQCRPESFEAGLSPFARRLKLTHKLALGSCQRMLPGSIPTEVVEERGAPQLPHHGLISASEVLAFTAKPRSVCYQGVPAIKALLYHRRRNGERKFSHLHYTAN